MALAMVKLLLKYMFRASSRNGPTILPTFFRGQIAKNTHMEQLLFLNAQIAELNKLKINPEDLN